MYPFHHSGNLGSLELLPVVMQKQWSNCSKNGNRSNRRIANSGKNGNRYPEISRGHSARESPHCVHLGNSGNHHPAKIAIPAITAMPIPSSVTRRFLPFPLC